MFPLSMLAIIVSRWGSMTPLRQFKGVPTEVIRKAEGKQFVSGLHSNIVRPLILVFNSHGTVILISPLQKSES